MVDIIVRELCNIPHNTSGIVNLNDIDNYNNCSGITGTFCMCIWWCTWCSYTVSGCRVAAVQTSNVIVSAVFCDYLGSLVSSIITY